jgi:hypothetical protein
VGQAATEIEELLDWILDVLQLPRQLGSPASGKSGSNLPRRTGTKVTSHIGSQQPIDPTTLVAKRRRSRGARS